MNKSTIICLVIAIILTLSASVYQRKTGPTYSKEISFTFNEQNYNVTLPRSHGGSDDCPIIIERKELNLNAFLVFRKYPTNDKYDTVSFAREGDILKAKLPAQPPAGKLQYLILVNNGEKSMDITQGKPVVIRFKGSVPAAVLIPHIIFMFLAMLLSNFSGLLAVAKNYKFRLFSVVTLICLILGGMILGPIVQKYAFGAYWTGIPFGWDLTDNKTLIGFVFWLLAVLLNMKKERPWLVIVASIIVLIIFSIPHSMFGSELNHTTGKVVSGFITGVFH